MGNKIDLLLPLELLTYDSSLGCNFMIGYIDVVFLPSNALWPDFLLIHYMVYAMWQCSSGKCAAAAAKSLQSCLTLYNPIDGSPPGSPVPGILQARTLEWVAVSFSNACKWKGKVKSLSHVRHLATPWLQPTSLLRPWVFPGKSTGEGCHCLLWLVSVSLGISLITV